MPPRAKPPGSFRDVGPFHVPGFSSRSVHVYAPAGADGSPRPVLFLFDGQNVFHDAPWNTGGWYIHEAIDGLDPRKTVVPWLVAIPHGDRRQDELTPWPTRGQGGRADVFLDWVIHTLIPTMHRELPILPGALGTAVGGASWGGLLALYAHYRNPEVFGGALCLSPSCWVGEGQIFQYLARRPTPSISRVYLYCGGGEGGGDMLPPARALAEHLRSRGYPRRQLMWREDPHGDHLESYWRRQLPRALRFMYQR